MIYLFMKLSEPEAAITPQNQVFAASALDPMKHAETKGSNHSSDSRICCLCPPERAEAKKRTKEVKGKHKKPRRTLTCLKNEL